MYPRFHRVRRGRVLAGVCTGLAAHLGVDVRWVRLVFLAIAAVPLAGVAVYGALTLLSDAVEEPGQALNPASARRFANFEQGARGGVGALSDPADVVDWSLFAAAVVLTFATNVASSAYLPATIGISIAILGALLVWRNTRIPDSQGSLFGSVQWDGNEDSQRPRPLTLQWVSAIGGVVLLAVGAGVAVYLLNSNVVGSTAGDQSVPADGRLTLGALGWAMAAGGALLIGLLVVCIPLWLRLWNTAAAAAEERARERERAKIASRIHDSVLQTLALIQKQSEDSRVTALARTQERQLRQWLFGAEESVKTQTIFGAIRVASGEVEDMFGVQIRPVFVGADRPTTESSQELVFAAREAMVNAAKHSGCDEINVYVESSEGFIELFVRDRGAGFDVSAVPADRHGVRDSIIARMQRIGGEVDIDSGSFGTELSFRLPLSAENASSAAHPTTLEEKLDD